jgi:ribose 5-phosphate isomerase B
MRIAVASDHAGYDLKEELIAWLRDRGHTIEDYGTENARPVDYPDVGRPAALSVAHGKADRAILIDGAGIAMSIVANRVGHVRAAVCNEPVSAELAREHNDANVLCLGGRMIGSAMARRIVEVFLETDFGGGRHERRVAKIEG